VRSKPKRMLSLFFHEKYVVDQRDITSKATVVEETARPNVAIAYLRHNLKHKARLFNRCSNNEPVVIR